MPKHETSSMNVSVAHLLPLFLELMQPQITVGHNLPICENDTLKFSSSSNLSGITYAWIGKKGFVSTDQNPVIINVGPSQSGIYKLTIDLNGCQSSDSVDVFIKPKPQPIANSNSPVCEGFPLNLTSNLIPVV